MSTSTATEPRPSPSTSRRAPARRGSRGARGRRRRGTGWLVLGLVVLLLPIPVTMWNDYQLDAVARGYERAVAAIQPNERARDYLAQAHAYNAALAASGHHAMPATPGVPGLESYLATLDAPETGGVLARLRIPSIAVDLPVYHTTNAEVLYRGAGHMFGSDLPVGGAGTTSVISAHTGMVNASMFDSLPRLADGADVLVEVMGETLRYRVRARQVVGPLDSSAITYEPGVDKLVLITCTPYGINSDRLLVEAVRVPTGAGTQAPGWRPRLSTWMLADLTLVGLALLVLAWRRRRDREGRRRPAPVGPTTTAADSAG